MFPQDVDYQAGKESDDQRYEEDASVLSEPLGHDLLLVTHAVPNSAVEPATLFSYDRRGFAISALMRSVMAVWS